MRNAAWMTIGAVACLALGCVPDLGSWTVVRASPGDGGLPPPGVDSGRPLATGGPCGTPTLFIAVHSLDGGGGSVMRFHLSSRDTLTPCGPITGGGALDPLPFAVAAPTDRYVLVASRSALQGVDPIDDRILFDIPVSGLHPNDAFAIDDPSWGDRVAGVAWSNLGSSASERGIIRTVETWSAEGSLRYRWDASTALNLGSATAISASAQSGAGLLAMNSSVYAASEVDPYGQVRTEPALVAPTMGVVYHAIASARSSTGVRRIAWSVTDAGEGAVAITDDPWSGATDPSGVFCEGMPCDFVHVAVDPSLPKAAWAICETPAGRSLMRFDYDRSLCEVFVSAEAFGSTQRPSYLAVQPSP